MFQSFWTQILQIYTTMVSVTQYYGLYFITIQAKSGQLALIRFDESHWEAYQRANCRFMEVLVDIIQDGDFVWVHDYHLMLLPSLLREGLEIKDLTNNVKIGFFLHTPFPSSEIYRILPVRKEVLTGVLSCDLVGFHTYDYARHFLSS